ncbi:hypothetical protein F4861DRAFT_540567 [Xylaria intraflava]|nr:hypothetical protein F4861DRAFT_540567 [Xylaria intraflava]
MRLASRALRDVQLKRAAPHLQASILLQCSRTCANGTCCAAVKASWGIRALSTSWPHVSVPDYDLILPELTHAFGALTKTGTGLASQSTTSRSLVLETSAFQQWRHLLADPARLAVESDFFRQGAAKEWPHRLLVDMFKHYGDMALWTCLLDYQVRINGPSGAIHVWKGLWGRKTLYDVEGPLAETFWRVMLEAALASNDLSFLEQIWAYSEWMYELYGVKWPQLYTTVMKHFLRTHQHRRALQWQLLLAPNFYPGSDEFGNIIKEFALDQELYRFDTLFSLYKINPDKNLYNTLLPYLFNFGASELARKWRRLFLKHGERPLTPVPLKPLLRFLKAYYPGQNLTPEEMAVLKSAPKLPDDDRTELSREFLNRVQGETFGISVKTYNDQIGAKWFASSWVSLDVAIPVISALGIEKIGPLSFQSIALRAGGSDGILSRVAQLRENGISVADSNYFRVIIYLASQKDDELLQDLLNSDLHPDVFEDINLQTQLINSATDISNWRTLRLLLVTRLVIFKQSAREAANRLLRLRFEKRDQDGVSRILKDMKSWQIPLDFSQANYIFESLIDDYNHEGRSLTTLSAAFYLAIFRQMKSMDVPVPLTHWRLIMINMSRQGRLEELGRLTKELVDLFLTSTSLRPGFVPVHVSDVPEAMAGSLEGVENLLGVYVPQDTLSFRHPIRDLFNSKLLTAVIENAFVPHPGHGFYASHGVGPDSQGSLASQIATVFDLLRIIKQQGTWLRDRKVQFVATNCLVNMYGPKVPYADIHRLMRSSNTLGLSEMKTLIDDAWGSELLQPLPKLREIIRIRRPGLTLDSRVFKLLEESEAMGEEDRSDEDQFP